LLNVLDGVPCAGLMPVGCMRHRFALLLPLAGGGVLLPGCLWRMHVYYCSPC
jgi:hypothetical protein